MFSRYPPSLIQCALRGSLSNLRAGREAFQKVGERIKETNFSSGLHELALIIDGPSDEVLNRQWIEGGSKGYVRPLSLKAWTPEEFGKMVGGDLSHPRPMSEAGAGSERSGTRSSRGAPRPVWATTPGGAVPRD
ncbi:MAG: hypothetical protein KGJ23_12435 [Euryarchaeota archaeon]|nr:hypothetical protein [Euryarchaeota archaeon]MDE1879912.1 hypothetical protein [Euryarchaeota archaeon]MDE2045495.1 hypothetical protein [Thermoplasmata archaeon]